MINQQRSVVLWDVDGTLANGRPIPQVRARPGIRLTLNILDGLGYENRAWSGNGARYAEQTCEWLELPLASYHSKPLEMVPKAALAELGLEVPPILSIDDVTDGQVGAWPFFHVAAWWSDPASEEVRDALRLAGEATGRAGAVLEALRDAYAAEDGDTHNSMPAHPHICRGCGDLVEDCWAHKARAIFEEPA